MSTTRADSKRMQRAVAVLLSSSLILSQGAPAFAEVRGLRSVSLPSAPVLSAAAPAPSLGLRVTGTTPTPALIPNAGQAIMATPETIARLTGLPVPAAAAPPAQAGPAAQAADRGQAGALDAAFSLARAAAPQHAGSSAYSIKGSLDARYDNASGGSSSGASEQAVEPEDWTSAPPVLPLSTLKPGWKPAETASAPSLSQRGGALKVADPIKESDVVLTEKLSFLSSKDSVKDVSGELESLAFGRRERYAADGAQQAVLAGETFVFVDNDGTVVLHDRAKKETSRVRPPMGEAQKVAASQDGKYLYVLAGGTVQRWDLAQREAVVIMAENVVPGNVLELNPIRTPDGKGQAVEIRAAKGEVVWASGSLAVVESGPREVAAESGAAPSLREAGNGFYLESRGGSTRIWSRALAGAGAAVKDEGTIPVSLKSVVALADRKTVFGLTDSGFVEWDLEKQRYRFFPVNGLRQALPGGASIDVSPDGQRVLVSAGGQLFFADLGKTARGVEDAEAETRKWSDENPMFIKDGLLHIGAFTFPVNPRFEAAPAENRWQRFWRWVFRKPAPQGKQIPPVSRDQWQALNLPANKKALYQTLKGFTLGQNVLYIGETGGGKTWMATMIAKLIGKKLYGVSFTEYTKNQDLLFSRTFGEEAAGKTGKSLEVVLQWLDDKEGGILLLDEMHKPLEGIAALNRILQERAYHLSGRDFVGDPNKHFVIGTMNPAKPPYKGEAPSGELSSRFGTTLKVNYLPPAEEAALLKIFYKSTPEELARKLVAIAKELRKIYPDVLPLPISSRTLLYIVQHAELFPADDVVEIFKTTFNPGTIVEDPSIDEAIDKALRAHDLKGASSKKG